MPDHPERPSVDELLGNFQGACEQVVHIAQHAHHEREWHEATKHRAILRNELRTLLARVESLEKDLASEREAKEQAERKLERYAGRRFPLLDGPSIPWSAIAPFEGQARRNHGQTLERLKERGGLSITEAIHVMECVEWHRNPRSAAIRAMSARDAALHLQALIDSAIPSPSRAPSTEEEMHHWPDGQIRPEEPYRCGAFETSSTYRQCVKLSDHDGPHELGSAQTPENTTNG